MREYLLFFPLIITLRRVNKLRLLKKIKKWFEGKVIELKHFEELRKVKGLPLEEGQNIEDLEWIINQINIKFQKESE